MWNSNQRLKSAHSKHKEWFQSWFTHTFITFHKRCWEHIFSTSTCTKTVTGTKTDVEKKRHKHHSIELHREQYQSLSDLAFVLWQNVWNSTAVFLYKSIKTVQSHSSHILILLKTKQSYDPLSCYAALNVHPTTVTPAHAHRSKACKFEQMRTHFGVIVIAFLIAGKPWGIARETSWELHSTVIQILMLTVLLTQASPCAKLHNGQPSMSQ